MDYKKVLLLHFTQGLSGRSIDEVTGVSESAINEFLKRFRESKELYYPLPEDVTNETIAALLYKKTGNDTIKTIDTICQLASLAADRIHIGLADTHNPVCNLMHVRLYQ